MMVEVEEPAISQKLHEDERDPAIATTLEIGLLLSSNGKILTSKLESWNHSTKDRFQFSSSVYRDQHQI